MAINFIIKSLFGPLDRTAVIPKLATWIRCDLFIPPKIWVGAEKMYNSVLLLMVHMPYFYIMFE